MIKAKTLDGTVILGIDADNVDRLKEGQPILIRSDCELALGFDIYICYGETTTDLVKQIIGEPN